MSVVEIQGGRIDYRYLMNKSKSDLAHMVMDYLRLLELSNLAKVVKERDELRAEVERLKASDRCEELLAEQARNQHLYQRNAELECWVQNRDEKLDELRTQLTAAQQSAKEQFALGMERAAEIAKAACNDGCPPYRVSLEVDACTSCIETLIREAAKESVAPPKKELTLL